MIVNKTQAVMCMHDIARYVEQHIEKGQLSADIRMLANRLNDIIKGKVKE